MTRAVNSRKENGRSVIEARKQNVKNPHVGLENYGCCPLMEDPLKENPEESPIARVGVIVYTQKHA